MYEWVIQYQTHVILTDAILKVKAKQFGGFLRITAHDGFHWTAADEHLHEILARCDSLTRRYPAISSPQHIVFVDGRSRQNVKTL